MANQMRWREAWSTAWGRLTGVDNEGSAVSVRLLFFLLFLLGTAWAGYRYYEMQLLRQAKTFTPSLTPQTVDADKKRLEGMIEQVRAASALRSNSFVWAQSMRDLGKNVFDDPAFLAEVPKSGGDGLPQIETFGAECQDKREWKQIFDHGKSLFEDAKAPRVALLLKIIWDVPSLPV